MVKGLLGKICLNALYDIFLVTESVLLRRPERETRVVDTSKFCSQPQGSARTFIVLGLQAQ